MCKSRLAYICRPDLTFFLLALLSAAVSGRASAQIAFKDVSVAAGLGGSASETWGAAWGDVNGDLYPDIFFSNHRARATLYRNRRDGTFAEVSRQVDVSKSPGWTGGAATVDTHGATWGDLDNDGDDDLVQAIETLPDRLYINDKGALTDRTLAYGMDKLGDSYTRQNLFVDFTGDGLLDLASVALARSAFYPQRLDRTFGYGAGVQKPMACANGHWAHVSDIHAAGGLELLCTPLTGSYPKVNVLANGIVSDVTAGFPQFNPVGDVATLDYNRDLRPDLFIVRSSDHASDAFQFAPNRFEAQFITAANRTKSLTFKSAGVITISASLSAGADPQGDPAFIDIGSVKWSPSSLVFQLHKADSRNWGIAAGALGLNIGYLRATGAWKISQGNSAGHTYTYVQVASSEPITALAFSGASEADRGLKPLLLKNTVNGLVTTTTPGLGASVRCRSAVAGDFDNDMDEDIFLACTGGSRNIANRLYMNNGTGTFSEVPGAGGAAGRRGAAVGQKAGTSESVVSADYDLDGFLDLLVTNGNNMRPVYIGGPKQLFRNLGNANNWIQFDLLGTTSNRKGIGAKVYVTSGGVTQYREQNGGYHRWSQNFMRGHVGLAGNTRADITVEWPDGTATLHRGLLANRVYRLRQDGSFVVLSG
jgi:hypothetical protein